MSDLRRFTSRATFVFSVFSNVACASSKVASLRPDSRAANATTSESPPRVDGSNGVGVAPGRPTDPPEVAARWTCLEPPRATVTEALRDEVIRSPVANRTFTRSEVASAIVELRLPKIRVAGVRPMIALDHHPARAAHASLPFRALLSEWETIEVGTHRLAVFWLDERGFPVRSSARDVLISTRTFVVERPLPLGAGEWLLVSPSGTLNGMRPPTFGHPFGLSLVHVGEGSGETTLEFDGAATQRGSFGPGECALAFERSGDYRLWLSGEGERTLLRTVTVNLDLEPPGLERPPGQ